jgi:exodeoxyribonuclease-5
MLGYADLLHPGDKVICCQNNYDHGVFNGQMFYVQNIRKEANDIIWCDLVDDLGTPYRNIPMFKDCFGGKRDIDDELRRELRDIDTCLFDYGYVITCHKSQGSEWKKVVVIEEPWAQKFFKDMNRWRYTAITRAAERLVYLR